ncbi:MAG: hypothetical protein ACK5MJ_03630 [Alphaproteobacteria bacterium]
MNFHLEELLRLPQVSQRSFSELVNFLGEHQVYHFIFLYGYKNPKPQAIDLCVILKELLAYYPQFSATLISEDSEDAYRKWAQMQARPSLALMYGMYQCEKMPKLALWNEYIQKINQAMEYDVNQFQKLEII